MINDYDNYSYFKNRSPFPGFTSCGKEPFGKRCARNQARSILHDPCIRATRAPSSSLASHHQSPNPTNLRLCTRHTMKQRFSSLDVKVSTHRL